MQIFFCFLLFSFPVCPCAFFQRVLQSVLSGKTDLYDHSPVKIAVRVLDLWNKINHPFSLRQVFLDFHIVDVHQFFTVHIPKFHRCQFLQILKCMRHFLVHQIPPFTYSILKGVFGNQILKFHKNIFSSGCQKVLPECYRYKDNSRFPGRGAFFSLSARFAYSRSKLTLVVFPGWQSWWGFRSPFPRYAQNLGFWLSGST